MRKTSVRVGIPGEIADLAPSFLAFAGEMVQKLSDNHHRTPPDQCDAHEFLTKLFGEVLEAFEQWTRNKRHPNMRRELADIANYAFLMSVSLAKENDKRRKKRSARKTKKRK